MAIDFNSSIKINGFDIAADGIVIKMLVIKNWFFDVVPRLEMVLNDPNDVLFNLYPIQDDSEFEIEINKNSNPDKQKETKILKFSVLDWESGSIISGLNGGHAHAITGYLKVDNLFFPNVTKSFKQKSSSEVIEEITNDLGLTYVKNFSNNTRDVMNWLQVGKNNHDMLNYVNERSFLSEDDTTLLFVNLDNELIHTSLKTETEKEVAYIGKLSQTEQGSDSQENFDDVIETNGELKDTPIFYYGAISNRTFGSRNKFLTYNTKTTYYDGSNHIENDVGNGNGDKLLNKLSQRNKDNIDKEVAQFEFGILNGGENFSQGVHSEFYNSQVRHKYTIMNFFKNQVNVKIKGNSLIKLMDIVELKINASSDRMINETHSGKYIVGGIIHTLGEETEYSVELVLYRSGINKPSFDSENLVVE